MTAQMCDFFEYEGTDYCLMGYTGGSLPSADDFDMHFYPGSTADARGHCMYYGIDDADMLVVKKVEVRGEEIKPVKHQFRATKIGYGTYYDNLNRIIPITGYMLFSDVWEFPHLYLDTIDVEGKWKYTLFEAQIDKGHVVGVSEISDKVRGRALERNRDELPMLWQGNTNEEKLANLERIWNITAIILPRRYDALYLGIWYFNFKENIDLLKSQTL